MDKRAVVAWGWVLWGLLLWGTAPAAAQQGFPGRWRLAGYAIGNRAGNDHGFGSYLMPEVVRLPTGGYRMYYNRSSATESEIGIAESPDGLRWTVVGTALAADPDPASREGDIGGASVVRLADGRWRLYYNATPRQTGPGQPPRLHYRSAISTDGITFEREPGVRIDIAPDDPASPFTLAGHGRFFRAADGRWTVILSANFAHDRGPSDLVVGESPDGLAWGGWRTAYAEVHDPAVVRLANGRYVVVAGFLDRFNGFGTSGDGRLWEPCLAPLTFLDAQGRPLPPRSGIGDLGIVRGERGELLLYANFGNPSTDIVVFRPEPAPPRAAAAYDAGGAACGDAAAR